MKYSGEIHSEFLCRVCFVLFLFLQAFFMKVPKDMVSMH